MKTHHLSVLLITIGVGLSLVGCGLRYRVVKDWKSRSKSVVSSSETGRDSPIYATAEALECKRDGTRLKPVYIKNPKNPYRGEKQIIAWYCPKEKLYWVRYEEGQGGALHLAWYGPFEVPEGRRQKAEGREQK